MFDTLFYIYLLIPCGGKGLLVCLNCIANSNNLLCILEKQRIIPTPGVFIGCARFFFKACYSTAADRQLRKYLIKSD